MRIYWAYFFSRRPSWKGEEVRARSWSIEMIKSRSPRVRKRRKNRKTFLLPCDNVVMKTVLAVIEISSSRATPDNFEHRPALIVRSSAPLTADCLFMTLTTRKSPYHPENFPRSSWKVYICGENDTLVLPSTAESATPRKKELNKLKYMGETIFPQCRAEKEQLCFRLMTEVGECFGSPVPELDCV